MSPASAKDWDPGTYQRFRGLRLRPALELQAQVSELPPGPVVDMGCGAGAMAEALALRYPDRELIGVDSSFAMLSEAEQTGRYYRLDEADATEWTPDVPPALLFSNALCHWLPDHAALFARWFGWLPPRGVLAVQMPRQFDAPSHALLRSLAAEMFPDRFDFTGWQAPVATPETYAAMLDPLGDVRVWETSYVQQLAPSDEGHPVRAFTRSTAMRPFLAKLDDAETRRFNAAYDAALAEAYPLRADGGVFFPFQRVFFVVTRPDPQERV